MKFFPRPRAREHRQRRNDVQVVRDRTTGEDREVCHGDAWQQRRQEVWSRDGGKCRWVQNGMECSKAVPLHEVKDSDGRVLTPAAEIHHRKRRGMGGSQRDDRMDNLVTLCRDHHNAAHAGRE